MASSCFLRSILFSSPTNLPSSRSNSRSVFFPKNLTCSFASSGSRFESFSVSAIGSGSSRRLADSRRKVSEVRSMATTAAETGKDEKKRVETFDTEENLAADLAKFTADLSDKFCKERGAFTVVVSGGSLIKSLRKLVESPYIDSIDWSRWHFFWVDERVVPKHHDDSNYKLAYDSFLSKVSIPPGNVYAINESLSAEAAADDYETCLKHLVKTNILRVSESTSFPKFDLMLLGMGPDGHVASLFPGHSLCNESEKWVTSITDSPKPPSERITFTFPVINSSAHVALVVCGSGKAEAVQAALNKTGDVPAGSVSAEDELVWFLDKPASSKL
uniref:6-phosphogluconolactonase n=1 Tax=Noccaea caerulescens TaxID=107243 RepID=A0A1J3GRS6_NOCCA